MKAIHFTSSGREIQPHEVQSGVTGFISWRRMNEVLRTAKELCDGEVLMSFQVDDRGLTFRFIKP